MKNKPERRLTGMACASTTLGDVELTLAAGAPRRVGWYRYLFGDDQWEWSEQVQRMHGYQPGTVTPSTQLVRAHKHPDDYRQITDTIELIRQAGQAFATRHRIHDVHGRTHHVIVVGDQLRDDFGAVIGVHGFYIDLTPEELSRQDHLSAAVSRVSEDRAAIEQAKGMLMVIYGIDAGSAFELLRRRSQQTNVTLRRLAEQVTRDFHAARNGATAPPKCTYDNLLASAHRRITLNASDVTDPIARTHDEPTSRH